MLIAPRLHVALRPGANTFSASRHEYFHIPKPSPYFAGPSVCIRRAAIGASRNVYHHHLCLDGFVEQHNRGHSRHADGHRDRNFAGYRGASDFLRFNGGPLRRSCGLRRGASDEQQHRHAQADPRSGDL